MSTMNIAQASFEIWGSVLSLILCLFTTAMVTQDKPGRDLWRMLLVNIFVLISDALAYVYRGDDSSFGMVMTRISNFALYFGEIVLMLIFAHFVRDIIDEKTEEKNSRGWLYAVYILMGATICALIITQFNGFYYYFDSTNHYRRGKGIILSFAIIGLAIILSLVQLAKHRKKFIGNDVRTLVIVIVLPLAAIVIQFMGYGLSLVNIAVTISIIIGYLRQYMNKIRAYTESLIEESRSETKLAMEKYSEMKERVSVLEAELQKMKER